MTASTRRELRSAATSTSTTAIGLIRALTDARPIKPTSTRCLSARRPNPGRGSPYRRGNSVQTTAATSRSPDLLSSLVAPSAGPITWPHEYDALVNAIPMNASTGRQFARVKTDAYVPLEIDDASRTAAVDVIIGADNKSGRNAAQHATSPPT